MLPEIVEDDRRLPEGEKLRVLILGWLIGSGSTGVYGAELADYLAGAGHRVTCLSAGFCDWKLKPYTKVARRRPVQFIELRNPPIVCATRPASPEVEITSPATENLLRDALKRTKPDVVLILDFPGWSAATIDICHDAGCKVAVFLQNFWPFCSRLTLVDRWGQVCRNYEDGERCVKCAASVIGSGAARWRARLPSLMWRSARLYQLVNGIYKRGAEARGSFDAPMGSSYAARRTAYAQAIGRADLIYGISRRTLELAAEFGTVMTNPRIVPICLRHVQGIRNERPTRPQITSSPIRFAYLGVLASEKGAGVLVSAFRDISPRRAVLHCFGGGSATYLKELGALADRLNPPVFHGRYVQSDLSGILRDIDVGIVPSICEDTRPNTVLEFQAAGVPVLGSRIGGIPEQIDDGENGRLFKPGDPVALRACLEEVLDSPEIIAKWRGNLPSDFQPQTSWIEIESSLSSLVRAGNQTAGQASG